MQFYYTGCFFLFGKGSISSPNFILLVKIGCKIKLRGGVNPLFQIKETPCIEENEENKNWSYQLEWQMKTFFYVEIDDLVHVPSPFMWSSTSWNCNQ